MWSLWGMRSCLVDFFRFVYLRGVWFWWHKLLQTTCTRRAKEADASPWQSQTRRMDVHCLSVEQKRERTWKQGRLLHVPFLANWSFYPFANSLPEKLLQKTKVICDRNFTKLIIKGILPFLFCFLFVVFVCLFFKKLSDVQYYKTAKL